MLMEQRCKSRHKSAFLASCISQTYFVWNEQKKDFHMLFGVKDVGELLATFCTNIPVPMSTSLSQHTAYQTSSPNRVAHTRLTLLPFAYSTRHYRYFAGSLCCLRPGLGRSSSGRANTGPQLCHTGTAIRECSDLRPLLAVCIRFASYLFWVWVRGRTLRPPGSS